MKSFKIAIPFLAFVILFFACKKDTSNSPNSGGQSTSAIGSGYISKDGGTNYQLSNCYFVTQTSNGQTYFLILNIDTSVYNGLIYYDCNGGKKFSGSYNGTLSDISIGFATNFNYTIPTGTFTYNGNYDSPSSFNVSKNFKYAVSDINLPVVKSTIIDTGIYVNYTELGVDYNPTWSSANAAPFKNSSVTISTSDNITYTITWNLRAELDDNDPTKYSTIAGKYVGKVIKLYE